VLGPRRHVANGWERGRPVTTEPQLDPLPTEVLDKLRQVSTSTVATQLYKRGFRQPQLLGVRPISQVVDGFVAEAFTMRFIPAREDVNTLDPYRSGNTLQWESIENVPPGHAIVVDSRGDSMAASGGDMLMTRAWKRGYDVRLEVHGSRDSVAAGVDDGWPIREPGVDFPAGEPHRFFKDRFQPAFRAQFEDFLEVAAGRRPSPCTVADALGASWIADACQRSFVEHRPVRLDEVRTS